VPDDAGFDDYMCEKPDPMNSKVRKLFNNKDVPSWVHMSLRVPPMILMKLCDWSSKELTLK